MSIATSSRPPLRQAPRRHSDARLAFVSALERVSRACGGRSLYRRRHLSRGRFQVRHEELPVRGLAPELEGLTCVALSDLHAGPFLRAGDLRDVVRVVRELEPDLVFLTGDLITHRWDDALELLDDLAGLRARLAVLAVFGNHDYRGREEARIVEAFAQSGVEFLRNAARRFELGRSAVTVVGLEDLEEARVVDLAAARSAVRPGDVELVLCHNPGGGPGLARRGCVAVFSGHTHGGQLDLPWARRAGPPHPGARVRLGETTLLVNRGLGTIGLPLRVGAPTEVLVARLAREAV